MALKRVQPWEARDFAEYLDTAHVYRPVSFMPLAVQIAHPLFTHSHEQAATRNQYVCYAMAHFLISKTDAVAA